MAPGATIQDAEMRAIVACVEHADKAWAKRDKQVSAAPRLLGAARAPLASTATAPRCHSRCD
mgnify:CR=1 FL=1